MAILEYHPPKTKLLDKRNENGGYYTAKCENCGTTFYPQRSNAKYCTANCGLIQHRIAVANGTAMKRGGKIENLENEVRENRKSGSAVSINMLYEKLMANNHTKTIFYRRKALFLRSVKQLEIGEDMLISGVTIKQITANVYRWKLK